MKISETFLWIYCIACLALSGAFLDIGRSYEYNYQSSDAGYEWVSDEYSLKLSLACPETGIVVGDVTSMSDKTWVLHTTWYIESTSIHPEGTYFKNGELAKQALENFVKDYNICSYAKDYKKEK